MFELTKSRGVVVWVLALTFLLTIFSPIAGGAEGAEIYCPECGTKNEVTNKFCGNCGTSLFVLQDKRKKKYDVIATRPGGENRDFVAKATYDFGVEAYKKGMYSDAKAAFREVIRKYPNSVYAPVARVWLEATKQAMKQSYAKAASHKKEKRSTFGTFVGVGATLLLLTLIF